jgi:hypothetical protein
LLSFFNSFSFGRAHDLSTSPYPSGPLAIHSLGAVLLSAKCKYDASLNADIWFGECALAQGIELIDHPGVSYFDLLEPTSSYILDRPVVPISSHRSKTVERHRAVLEMMASRSFAVQENSS